MRESLKKAQEAYRQKCKIVNLRINKETEPDILAWIEKGNAGSRIKKLIREDIQKSPAN
jgi:hypothetical protein